MSSLFDFEPRQPGALGYLNKIPYETDKQGVFTMTQVVDSRTVSHLHDGALHCGGHHAPMAFNLEEYPQTGSILRIEDLYAYQVVYRTEDDTAAIIYTESGIERQFLEEEPLVSARTLQELIKLIDEWAHLEGNTAHQKAARALWKSFNFSDEAVEEIRQIPNQQPARFVAGDEKARERSPSIQPLTEGPFDTELYQALSWPVEQYGQLLTPGQIEQFRQQSPDGPVEVQ